MKIILSFRFFQDKKRKNAAALNMRRFFRAMRAADELQYIIFHDLFFVNAK